MSHNVAFYQGPYCLRSSAYRVVVHIKIRVSHPGLHCLFRQARFLGKEIEPTHLLFTYNTIRVFAQITYGTKEDIQERSLAIFSQSILRPSSNRSPYIFTLVQKVKEIGHTKFMHLNMEQYFAKTLKVISFKNDVYFFHGRS